MVSQQVRLNTSHESFNFPHPSVAVAFKAPLLGM